MNSGGTSPAPVPLLEEQDPRAVAVNPLAALRLGLPEPRREHVCWEPVPEPHWPGWPHLPEEFRCLAATAAAPPSRPVRVLAVDLDETLLLSSQAHPQLWQWGRGYHDPAIAPGYHYAQLRFGAPRHRERPGQPPGAASPPRPPATSRLRLLSRAAWVARYRAWRGRAPYHWADPSREPSLSNPRICVAPRWKLWALLMALRTSGIRLILVTASARARVDYLRARLPGLFRPFCEVGHPQGAADAALPEDHRRSLNCQRILCAEDLATIVATAHLDCPEGNSRAAHAARPRSLAAKTPWAVAQLTGSPYDLLLDDSPVTAALLSAGGLSSRLILVDAARCDADYENDLVRHVATQCGYPHLAEAVLSWATRQGGLSRESSDFQATGGVRRSGASDGSTGNTALCHRLEDPYYLPLCHRHDQLPSD